MFYTKCTKSVVCTKLKITEDKVKLFFDVEMFLEGGIQPLTGLKFQVLFHAKNLSLCCKCRFCSFTFSFLFTTIFITFDGGGEVLAFELRRFPTDETSLVIGVGERAGKGERDEALWHSGHEDRQVNTTWVEDK